MGPVSYTHLDVYKRQGVAGSARKQARSAISQRDGAHLAAFGGLFCGNPVYRGGRISVQDLPGASVGRRGAGNLCPRHDDRGILWTFQRTGSAPSRRAFCGGIFGDRTMAAAARISACLLYTSAYPAPADEANLRTIPELARRFNCPVGLSDHTMGIAVPVAAVALGACIIEKHLCLCLSLIHI